MAVVSVYGTGYKDPAALKAVDAVYAAGNMKSIMSLVTVTNGNSIASKYYVGKIPSNAILDPTSFYDFGAITSVSDIDLGFANDPDALVDGDDVSSAGTQTLRGHGTHTLARSIMKAWELAGYTSDPGGELDVFWTIKAAATATASIMTTLRYVKRV